MKRKTTILVLCIAFVVILGLPYIIFRYSLSIRGDITEVNETLDKFVKEFDELENSVGFSTVSEIEQVERILEQEIEQWESTEQVVLLKLNEINKKSYYIKPFMNVGEYGSLRGEIGALRGKYGSIEGQIGALEGKLAVLKLRVQ